MYVCEDHNEKMLDRAMVICHDSSELYLIQHAVEATKYTRMSLLSESLARNQVRLRKSGCLWVYEIGIQLTIYTCRITVQ